MEFRGPEKIYLPIPRLPQKASINFLPASALSAPACLDGTVYSACYPGGRVISQPIRRILRHDQHFAVLALGLEGPKWWTLVYDYLDHCDDEHSFLQEMFIHAMFKKYGFTAPSIQVLVHGVQSMQELKPDKEFRTLIANEDSLNVLLEIKGRLEYYLPEESNRDSRTKEYLWRDVLWAIWGKDSENGGGRRSSRRLLHECESCMRKYFVEEVG